jgi:integrase/recombinase XerD
MYFQGETMVSNRKKLPVVLEYEETQKLLEIPNKRYLSGIRNRTILSIMLNMGLRVSEVVDLKNTNVNTEKKKLRVVNGKYAKDRDLSIPGYTLELIEQWKKVKPKSSYFFPTSKGTKLSVRYIQAMVRRYDERANINKGISPHSLRHTFATEFYKQTKDIETLRKILGHSDISTTQIYVTLANMDVENAMNGFREFY